MLKIKNLMLVIIALLVLSFSVQAQQTARLQVIHNAADPAVKEVDVYVNGEKFIDNFAFRKATPFVDVPAGVAIEVGLAPASSVSSAEVVKTFTVILDANETYVGIANGVLNPAQFSVNPDGKDINVTLFVKRSAREAAVTPGNVEFAVLHGSTDAPTVDVVARDVATLVDDAAYGAFTDYLSVPASDYILDITDASGSKTVVTYSAPLSGLANGAAIVFASGFFNPAMNQNGPGFGVFAALPDGNVIELPALTTARVQVIHNAADPAAEMVDVYLNGSKLIDDFKFRAATPFIDAPANTNIEIGIAPATSASSADIIAKFNYNLMAARTYVIVANGVLDPSGFAVNPDGKSTAFTLIVKENGREKSMTDGNVDFAVLHGSTDAPTVDIYARNVAQLVDDAFYSAFTDYISVPAADYILDVTDASGNVTVLTLSAPLSGLAGGAAVVFASGFFAPASNQDGMAFGVFAALPDGNVIQLSVLSSARLQVIHNAADPAAAKVDIYVNDTRLLRSFRFRQATPFIDAPANTPISIGVAPANSKSVSDVIAKFEVTLMAGETYIAIANGVLNPSQFSANPDGKEIAFNILVKSMARETSQGNDTVDAFVFHGATDAPSVDLVVRGAGVAVDNAGYGDMTGYLTLPIRWTTVDLTLAEDNSAVVASYQAGFWNYAGSGVVLFASGFLTPSANKDGAAFEILAAFPDGQVRAIKKLETARLQVIHNSADPAAEMVDVYVNGGLLINDFKFRAATPFIDVPANTALNIGVAPATSSSADEAIATFTVSLLGGETYVAIANGVVGDGFSANPDGKSIGFTLFAKDGLREKSRYPRFAELMVFHGATDAPAVDVVVRNSGAILVDNLAYGDFAGYATVPAGQYTLDITLADDNQVVVVSYKADLTGLAGGSAIVFASGFLTPSANNNGAGFGLYAALPSGDVVALPVAMGSTGDAVASIAANNSDGSMPIEFGLKQNYPNPFNPSTTIAFSLSTDQNVSLKVYDIMGREVASLVSGQLAAGQHQVVFDARGLATGKYFYRLQAGSQVEVKEMMLVK